MDFFLRYDMREFTRIPSIPIVTGNVSQMGNFLLSMRSCNWPARSVNFDSVNKNRLHGCVYIQVGVREKKNTAD